MQFLAIVDRDPVRLVPEATGERAQAASVTVLENRDGILPLRTDPRPRVYAENIGAAALASLGDRAERPEDADLAIVRIGAPFEPRDDLFLERWFHQGSLEFPPGLAVRLRRIAEAVPLVLVVNLDRPGVLTPFTPFVSALAVDDGSSDEAVLAALTGAVAPRGALPVEIARSMDAVRASRADVPDDTAQPVYPRGSGLRIG